MTGQEGVEQSAGDGARVGQAQTAKGEEGTESGERKRQQVIEIDDETEIGREQRQELDETQMECLPVGIVVQFHPERHSQRRVAQIPSMIDDRLHWKTMENAAPPVSET